MESICLSIELLSCLLRYLIEHYVRGGAEESHIQRYASLQDILDKHYDLIEAIFKNEVNYIDNEISKLSRKLTTVADSQRVLGEFFRIADVHRGPGLLERLGKTASTYVQVQKELYTYVASRPSLASALSLAALLSKQLVDTNMRVSPGGDPLIHRTWAVLADHGIRATTYGLSIYDLYMLAKERALTALSDLLLRDDVIVKMRDYIANDHTKRLSEIIRVNVMKLLGSDNCYLTVRLTEYLLEHLEALRKARGPQDLSRSGELLFLGLDEI